MFPRTDKPNPDRAKIIAELYRQHKEAFKAKRDFPDLQLFLDWDGIGIYHPHHDLLVTLDADKMNPESIRQALVDAQAKYEELETQAEREAAESAHLEDQIAAAEACKDWCWV
jgi:hypothetical protein